MIQTIPYRYVGQYKNLQVALGSPMVSKAFADLCSACRPRATGSGWGAGCGATEPAGVGVAAGEAAAWRSHDILAAIPEARTRTDGMAQILGVMTHHSMRACIILSAWNAILMCIDPGLSCS